MVRLAVLDEELADSLNADTNWQVSWEGAPLTDHWSFQDNPGTRQVVVFTNCGEVELFLNGRSLGSHKSSDFSDGVIRAEVPVIISNRRKLAPLAEEFGVPFRMIGDAGGAARDDDMVRVLDEFDVDYVVLARYMRILPANTCWQFAGGRIINLHHGLLPGFPGFRPYHNAYNARMLTFGATCHFIIPELDAGNQTINQRTFSVVPGTSLEEVIARGESENEPACLVEGVRGVVDREVYLHFHRVVARPKP
jgi:formyltetrahydrofolate deformylase